MPRLPCHQGQKIGWYPFNSRLVGPQSQSGHFGKGANLLPVSGNELHFFGYPARILIIVPTEPFELFKWYFIWLQIGYLVGRYVSLILQNLVAAMYIPTSRFDTKTHHFAPQYVCHSAVSVNVFWTFMSIDCCFAPSPYCVPALRDTLEHHFERFLYPSLTCGGV
jgi:hypothetical protein